MTTNVMWTQANADVDPKSMEENVMKLKMVTLLELLITSFLKEKLPMAPQV